MDSKTSIGYILQATDKLLGQEKAITEHMKNSSGVTLETVAKEIDKLVELAKTLIGTAGRHSPPVQPSGVKGELSTSNYALKLSTFCEQITALKKIEDPSEVAAGIRNATAILQKNTMDMVPGQLDNPNGNGLLEQREKKGPEAVAILTVKASVLAAGIEQCVKQEQTEQSNRALGI